MPGAEDELRWDMRANELRADNFKEIMLETCSKDYGTEVMKLEIAGELEEWSGRLREKRVGRSDIAALVRNLFHFLPEHMAGFWEWDGTEPEISEKKYKFLVEICEAADPLVDAAVDDLVASGILFADRSFGYMAQRKEDMEMLETVMRQWNEALELFEGRFSIEMQYELSKMHFECINAYLFETHEMFSDAREYYGRAAKSAKRGLLRLVDCDVIRDPEIKAYAMNESWNCIVVLSTLYRQYIRIQDVSSALRAADVVYEYWKKLKPYIVEDVGYCARAARELWALSAAQNSCGDMLNAGKTLDEATDLYETLYRAYGNLYAQAMYLQSKVFRYIQLLQQGQAEPEKIETLDRERKEMILSEEAMDFERSVGESVGVMIDMYRGFYAMMGEQYVPALKAFRAADENAEKCIPYFKELSGNRNMWLASVGKDIAHRLETTQISCAQQAAGCEYFLNDPDEAARLFEKTLRLANEKQDSLPEIDRMRLVSQVYMMLGDIYGNKGDVSQAEFYFEQLVRGTRELAEKTDLPVDWGTFVHGAAFAMEYVSKQKNTEKAKSYAEMGIQACERLRRVDAGHQALQLERQFEKTMKKKSGFFSKWF